MGLMHYFQFNISDWGYATKHLSLEEEGAYLRLISYYYDTEQPIFTKDLDKIFRRCRIPDDLGCFILEEFFMHTNGDCWIHNRCDDEIQKYQEKSLKAKKSIEIRWDKYKSKEKLNDSNTVVIESYNESNTNHKPITNNQEPLTNINTIYATSVAPVDCPHEEVVNLYHSILPELRHIEVWSDTRKGYLKQRWREILTTHKLSSKAEGLEYFTEFFQFIRESPFLMGKVERKDGKPFQADLEWILKPTNFIKIIERKYHK